MAQDGDTITYTYDGNTNDNNELIPQEEDVSTVNEATVEYCDAAGGTTERTTGGYGGSVENATINLSGQDSLYIFVSSEFQGRYSAGGFYAGGSTEVTLFNTDGGDSDDEPFLVAAGGGGSGRAYIVVGEGSNGGSRGGVGFDTGSDGSGVAPPEGGDGAKDSDDTGSDGDGAIDDQNRGLVSGGTTIKGGGSGPDTDGEVKISYASTLSPPDPPSNLSAEVQ